MTLDDLPQRPKPHELADESERAFEAAINRDRFFVQGSDRRDYGTDYHLEVLDRSSVTNLRVQVQLKGTDGRARADDTIAISVARTNLNYLLAQPDSIYVCFHRPSNRLLATYVSDVYRRYERAGGGWETQDSVSVVFGSLFDDEFQSVLHKRLLASGRGSRDERLSWTMTPPEKIASAVDTAVPRIEVPPDRESARELLSALYDGGQDAAISKNFDAFAAVLGEQDLAFLLAYLAEINLGINHRPSNEPRIRAGIALLRMAQTSGIHHVGSILYSIGNAWLALEDYDQAQEIYLAAMGELDESGLQEIEARCAKNLGTALQELGHEEEARACYGRALDLDPDLPEANLAVATSLLKDGKEYDRAVEHLERITRRLQDSKIDSSTVTGWKVQALFGAGRAGEAFGLVNLLIAEADRLRWVWPWLAMQVAAHGKSDSETAPKAIAFWRAYLRAHSDSIPARREVFLSHFVLQMSGKPQISFEEFRTRARHLVDGGVPDPAFVWDRVGHWAQEDGDWDSAEVAFRQAWELEPQRYGYCLGTALNFTQRYSEALPVLLEEAESLQPDAMSWFQVGVANDGLYRFADATAAYEKALVLDDDYALARFNLGGSFWNDGDLVNAVRTWLDAVDRYPDHPLASRVRDEFLTPQPPESS